MALLDSLMSGLSPSAALRRGLRQFEQGNVKGAFVLLSRAARSGIPEAEFRIGRCYLEEILDRVQYRRHNHIGIYTKAKICCNVCDSRATFAMCQAR